MQEIIERNNVMQETHEEEGVALLRVTKVE